MHRTHVRSEMPDVLELISEIKKLKKEKNAIILGHNYMEYGVQLVSDFTGDSYDLAVKAVPNITINLYTFNHY